MALVKFKTFYPDYRDTHPEFDDINSYDVYAQDNSGESKDEDKVGSINDILVDSQSGQFRYFVVDTGFWIFGKKVLLPVGLASIDSTDRRIYVRNLTKEQVENLPKFDELEKLDYDQEEQVRNVYRPNATATTTTASTAATPAATTPAATAYDRNSYTYDRDPGLYNMNDRDHSSLKLYEERLIANKQRQKTGEVTLGKHVETEQARVSVPVSKERVVIERNVATNPTPVDTGSADFQEGEVARVETYEETPDIRKETFVREEVRAKKVVEQETVTAEEAVRREELDIDKKRRPKNK